MMNVSVEDQEQIERIIEVRRPDAETILDLDAEGMDVLTTRLRRQFDVIICIGPSFTSLRSDEDMRSAFRTFTAHARLNTQLIVRKPDAFHQAQLETRARTCRFMYYTRFGELRVFGFGSQNIDATDDGGF